MYLSNKTKKQKKIFLLNISTKNFKLRDDEKLVRKLIFIKSHLCSNFEFKFLNLEIKIYK
jgi:hypothetical protein